MTERERAKYIKILKKKLSKFRLYHSECVSKEAVRLAEKYRVDVEKAELAGLLHDIMKDVSGKDPLEVMKKCSVDVDDMLEKTPKLWHSYAGAAYVEKELGIDDEEVINAIKYHTTARAGMTRLEKVIYIADFTSADRDYDDVDDMRRAANKGLDDAMRYALSYTVADLASRGLVIHPDTFAAYNEVHAKK